LLIFITAAQLENTEDEVRGLFAQIINADPCSISIAPSTSHAVSMAALNIPLDGPKKCVLVMENQMASNVMPWQERVASTVGGRLFVANCAEGDWTKEILR
jgi:selenocysteine lyase/cysteine desulfurase